MPNVLGEPLLVMKPIAAGIHQLNEAPLDFQGRCHPIARYTRRILHNADQSPAQCIEKRTLADIGPTNDGDDGELGHGNMNVAVYARKFEARMTNQIRSSEWPKRLSSIWASDIDSNFVI